MDPFIIKVFLSLVIGVIFVIVSTNIAERVSGKLGGLILGFPSTALISILFIGLTQGVKASMVSSMVLPLSSGLYCFYYISYLLLVKKGFKIGFLGSLIIWFMFAFITSRFTPSNIYVSSLSWLFLVVVCIAWTVKNIHINYKLIPNKIVGNPLWFKALLTGIAISLIVIISKLVGPKWGGIFATFPALATSTYLITFKSGGIEFTRLIAKNILISTTTTIGLFGIFSYFFFQ